MQTAMRKAASYVQGFWFFLYSFGDVTHCIVAYFKSYIQLRKLFLAYLTRPANQRQQYCNAYFVEPHC